MYPRFATTRIKEALEDTRVVLISGPRQSGKTTLATGIATDKTPFLTLDDATVLRSAIDDPVGFVRGLDRAVIDEIQRAPELLLAIKNTVDDDKRPGRFLLTGSANLMTIPNGRGFSRWPIGSRAPVPTFAGRNHRENVKVHRQSICSQKNLLPTI